MSKKNRNDREQDAPVESVATPAEPENATWDSQPLPSPPPLPANLTPSLEDLAQLEMKAEAFQEAKTMETSADPLPETKTVHSCFTKPLSSAFAMRCGQLSAPVAYAKMRSRPNDPTWEALGATLQAAIVRSAQSILLGTQDSDTSPEFSAAVWAEAERLLSM